jgi:hypothetical protein
MSAIGYTDKQAERLMQKIDLQAARACDALVAMYDVVPDQSYPSLAYLQGEIMQRCRQLQDTVRRRKR